MSKKNKQKIDYKARLEHKLYLARENPEPIFDLDDCDLKQVPSGVYSLCKVFLKKTLLLGNNRLENLNHGGKISDLKNLIILDIQKNNFHSLPDEIYLLNNLRELYVNDNRLKKLPESITQLHNLRNMDVSNNSLHHLPETLGNLGNLQKLSITGNKHLKKLPQSFSGLQNLIELSLDSDKFIYPPNEICSGKISNIIQFIVNDCGIPYVSTCPLNCDGIISDKHISTFDNNEFQIQKQQELLEIEKHNEAMQQQELELHNSKRAGKQRLLDDLVKEQGKFEDELIKLQREKDFERHQFIKELQEEELQAEESINRLIEMSSKPHSQFLEYEAHEDARLFEAITKNNTTYCRQDILRNMQKILEEETKQFEKYSQHKNEITQNILLEECEMQSYLNDVIEKRNLNKTTFSTQLQKDNVLQMAAVGALLERSDARSWSLVQQVKLVGSQLAKLTAIEMDKRKLQIDAQINDLSQKRVELSSVLLDLLSQQAERRNQLISNLHELEVIEQNKVDDFWLIQYQRLLNRRPEFFDKVQRDLDPEFLHNLLMAGVIHCLPFLAPWAHSMNALGQVTDEDLLNVGIVKEIEREKIRTVIHNYIKLFNKINVNDDVTPSAPLDDENEASAPPLDKIDTSVAITSIECVICLDERCAVIYLPCGHLCTCSLCSNSVELCPLCRANIDRRIQVIIP